MNENRGSQLIALSVSDILRSFGILIKSRLKEIIMWVWFTVVACLIVSSGSPPLLPTILSAISIFLISISVYIYNDVVDLELDKINTYKSHRPLSSGKVTSKVAMILVYISAILGLSISLLLNIQSFLIGLAYLILFTLYSYPKIYLKNTFVLKEIILSSGHIIMALFGSYGVTGTFSDRSFFASILFSVLTFAFIPALNDTTDIEADREFGYVTIAMVLSWKRRMQLLLAGLLIIMTLTPFTYTNFGFNMILPLFVVAGGLIFMRFMFPIMNTLEETKFIQARKIGYIYFISLNIFTVIASLNLGNIL